MPSGASSVWVNGPLIVGAGPSGLAVAACLKTQHVPFVILERSHCIASLWQHHTYDRLKLHLPKRFCHLPNLPFPHHFPQYPSRAQFLSYLDAYAKRFGIKPRFGEAAVAGRYDETCGMWRVRTGGGKEYICEWLVVATGENGERVVPEFEGLPEFGGKVVHAAEYKSGEGYKGKKVLVVGCGNSGMEICLDLCQHNAIPSMVVRDTVRDSTFTNWLIITTFMIISVMLDSSFLEVHVLPREVFGKSTFEMAAAMMKWLPLWLVDRILLTFAWLALGNTEKYGLKRPKIGPFQLKKSKGKTPVLDIGTVEKIKSGDIKIVSGINKFFKGEAELMDSRRLDVDAVILATGYRSNVHSWLQESEIFSKDGETKAPFPDGWKGENGLYSIGFTKRGLFGVFSDAVRAAEDIGRTWKRSQAKKFLAYRRKCNSQL